MTNTAYNLKSPQELDLLGRLAKAADESPFSMRDRMQNFPVYAPRQAVARFLNRFEMYKRILDVHGSILEFGVYKGAGAFSWLHFASILEPYNINRKIFAFDTFEGFPELSAKDPRFYRKRDLDDASHQEMLKLADLHRQNIPLAHVPRLSFVKGDICKTLPKFLKENPHVIPALVYIDVDIYKPTKAVLRALLKRMPKGSLIAFDELNDAKGPGETVALLEEVELSRYELRRHNFDSNPCYLVVS